MTIRSKRWLATLLALCMVAGLLPVTGVAAAGTGTVAKGDYMDAEGNTHSYELSFDTPLPAEGGELAAGNYYLTEDLDLTTDLTVAPGATVKLDLAGRILRGTGRVAVITVGDNARLEVYDSNANADNPTPTTHYYTEDENGVWVFDDANTSGTPWTGGVITGGGRAENLSSSIPSHGGVFACYTSFDPVTSPVAITLFAGSICGNRTTSSRPSAGIVADNAKVFVAGGSICGNQRGLCVQAPSFTLTGGLLQGDSSFDSFPARSIEIQEAHVTVDGVTEKHPGTMVMRGGTVRNATIQLGGAIPAQHCQFTMYGGEITGTVDSQNNYTDYLIGVFDSTFEMYGGSIHDASADHVIYMNANLDPEEDSSATFLLDGGAITNNAPRGDLISASAKETIIIRGGKITGNTASRSAKTGTVLLSGTTSEGSLVGTGTLVMEGGEISGNQNPGVLALFPADFSLSGAVKLSGNSPSNWGDIRLMEQGKVTIAGPLRNVEKIAVSMETPGVFTDGWSAQMGDADPADHFTSAMDGYTVSLVDGEAALAEPSAPPTPSTGTVAKGEYMDAEGNMQSYEVHFDTPLTQTSGTLAPGNYYLADDLNLTDLLGVYDGVVRIDLAGHVLRGADNKVVFHCRKVNGTCGLEIYDSNANEDNQTHAKHYYTIDQKTHRWVFDDTAPSETFIEGGVITGTSTSKSPLFNIQTGTNLTLYQGTISGVAKAIIVNEIGDNVAETVSLLIAGGAIMGNGNGNGYPGGGVVETCGTLVMTGGEIADNHGIGVEFVDTFILRGGKIRDNSGIGVLAYRSRGTQEPDTQDMVMYGGEISSNRGGIWGGGIYLPFGEATLDIRGGRIVSNTAAHVSQPGRGGGIFTRGNIFLSSDAEISGNTANANSPSDICIDGGAKIHFTPERPLRTNGKIGIYLTHSHPPDGLYSAGWDQILGDTDPNGIFTSGWGETMGDADPTDYFISNENGYGIKALTINGVTEVALVPIYTATFMADGTKVDAVTFLKGDTALAEPEVPVKAHYDGAWERYDLAIATGNITANAVYTLNDDHTGFESTSVTPPTCTQGGYTTFTCSVCGNVRTGDETAPTAHTEVSVVTPPTCTQGGCTTFTCSVCGNVRQGDETDVLGHDYQLDPDKSVAATPGHDGYEYYVCVRCGDAYQKPLIAPIVTHTATFKVGDAVIGQVVFEEGSATLTEPVIPPRPNYVGRWEPYDLAAAKSDLTIQGHYTPVDPDAVSDIGGGAEAEYNNGVVTIDLSAKATSRTIKVISQKTKPVDVVLVLDQSGSMKESLTTLGRQSKRDALVDCANSFVASLYENAQASGADHRVALVGFAHSAYGGGNYKNTGLLTTESGKSVRYDRIKDSDLRAALLRVNDGGQLNAKLLAGIRSIQAEGATAADLGLRTARDIFAANPNQDDRERIVIFITDGTPTAWGNDASLVRQTGAAAITVANTIKNGQSAKIYSIGVHADADPEAAFTSAKDGVTTDRRGDFSGYDFNRFLHAVSSNYPAAVAMDDLGTGDKNGGYYMGVRDTGNLGSIFTNILYSTVYELKAFDKATLSYTLSQEFTLTMEQELALREKLQRELGLADADIQIDRSADGTTHLTFRNVKVKEVYAQDGTLYYQAAVRFQVSANGKTLAGGNVSTGAGDVSYEGSAVTAIQASSVTIPAQRSVVAFTINGQVYRLCDVTPGDTIALPETELASWSVSEGTVAEAGYAVFEADSVQSREYSIVWNINGKETIQKYALGEVIVPPEVPAKKGCDFTGWSRAVPYTMPAYDLVCVAIYSPAHVHSFEPAYQAGNCKTGLISVSRCACGETQEETAAPADHNFTAVLTDNGSAGTALERVVCTRCGHSEEQNINFKVSYSSGWKTTVLDLNLLQNEVNVTEPEDEIEMRFFVGNDGGRRYTVTRIDADGHRTTYQTRSENGYLVFRADHFSIYVLSELDESTSHPAENVSYENAVGILDSKVNAAPTTSIEGGPQGGGGSNPGGSPSGSSSRPQTQTPPVSSASFSDVAKDSFYADAVAWAVERGITNGTGEGRFSPDAVCTRSQMVTFLWRAAGRPEPSATLCPFADVSENAAYYKAVLWAVEQGITVGTAADTFGPLVSCDRGQMVTFLYRYAQSPQVSGAVPFPDVPEDAFYANAVVWATQQGITKGTSDATFSPEATCTRAQMATFLYRFLAK